MAKPDSRYQHAESILVVTLQHRQGNYRLTLDTAFITGYLDSEIIVPEAKATLESMRQLQAKIEAAGRNALTRLLYITAKASPRHQGN